MCGVAHVEYMLQDAAQQMQMADEEAQVRHARHILSNSVLISSLSIPVELCSYRQVLQARSLLVDPRLLGTDADNLCLSGCAMLTHLDYTCIQASCTALPVL